MNRHHLGDSSTAVSRRALLLSPLAGALPTLPAWAQTSATRVALVIGNAAYASAPLRNPANDAAAMATLLGGMGFRVVPVRDGTKPQIEAAIAQTRQLLQGQQGIGLMYYAGHGLQVNWRNYLLPVDANPQSAADVPSQTIDMQTVIDAFSAADNSMNILVLDACRDNPFGNSASAKGLAPLDAPSSTFFAYATAPGNVADDGAAADGNGLYTRFLLQELPRPQARIEDVFKRVRLQVRQASQGRQIPWESTSLVDDFVFASGQKAEAPGAMRREAEFDAEKSEWDRIKDSTRVEDFYAFLQRYPNGRISELAQFRLDQLSRPQLQAMQTVTMLPAGVDRFRVGDSWAFERTDRLAGNSVSRRRGGAQLLRAPRGGAGGRGRARRALQGFSHRVRWRVDLAARRAPDAHRALGGPGDDGGGAPGRAPSGLRRTAALRRLYRRAVVAQAGASHLNGQAAASATIADTGTAPDCRAVSTPACKRSSVGMLRTP